MDWLTWLWLTALAICGVFTTMLGVAHFFFPVLLDFNAAIPRTGPPLKSFRLGPIRYPTKRSDVYGIAWVMNHAASYTLVSIGIVDLVAFAWFGSTIGMIVLLWISGWWFIRAASQVYLGRRAGDWWIVAGFAWFGLVHLGAALWSR
ncbi:MAG: hypothetical protein IPK16_11870 [Anaerolineales bacterium]|nr:hypothetical protein [Anaerolineales bacterium]